ncbi:LysR family transcriptional regulator [Tabrizicola sp.]|uniref:LysR family transcriptional regulator n=1 Tax=Tabrizicola sp. TaxID=2005166 RepID=UPI003F2B3F22
MRLEWLEDILAVAETGSFSEAAERRHLTQSAFSRRIGSIEEHVGLELFDRSRKPVQLHPTTRDQRDQIARLVADLRQLVTDLRQGDRKDSNRIVVASQHALTTALTPTLLSGIQSSNADIFVKLRSANLDDCFALLLSRQADIAIVYRLPDEEHPISTEYIETAIVGRDRLIPVYSSAKVSYLNERFAMGELPYIAYPGDVFFGRVLERMVLPTVRRLTRPTPKVETALTLAALEMAAVGVAVAWIPGSLAAARMNDGSLFDLSETLPSLPLDVTAVRLRGTAGPVETAIWSHLVAMAAIGES